MSLCFRLRTSWECPSSILGFYYGGNRLYEKIRCCLTHSTDIQLQNMQSTSPHQSNSLRSPLVSISFTRSLNSLSPFSAFSLNAPIFSFSHFLSSPAYSHHPKHQQVSQIPKTKSPNPPSPHKSKTKMDETYRRQCKPRLTTSNNRPQHKNSTQFPIIIVMMDSTYNTLPRFRDLST